MLSTQAKQAIAIAKTIKAQQDMPLTTTNILQARAGADQGNPFEFPANVTLLPVATDRVNGEFYFLNRQATATGKTVLMFLHGGAYMTGTVKSRRWLGVNLALN